MKIALAFCIACLFIANPSLGLDSSTIETAYSELETYFIENESRGFVPLVVRLIFHDCVSGTCDGCINLDNDSNNGLSNIIGTLDDLYVGSYDDDMSRADFWALAAIAAIKAGSISANGGSSCTYGECPKINMPDATFKYGRTDCANSPSTNEVFEFPEGTMDRSAMLEYFADHFGYTTDEVVALMGAHSLGLNVLDNSGYEGPYTSQKFDLDNQYYIDMLPDSGLTWTNEQTSAGKYQFTSGSYTRLNTDLELVYDLSLNSDDASCSCTVGTDCDLADSYDLVQTYANDADTWATDFVAIMNKLMETGYDNLTEYGTMTGTGDSTTTTTTSASTTSRRGKGK